MTPTTPSSESSGILRCRLAGDLTSTTAPEFRQVIERQLSENISGWTTLEIDLSAARLLDSIGLNLLVGTVKQAQARGARTRIITAHPMVRRILTFTRLDRHAEVVGT